VAQPRRSGNPTRSAGTARPPSKGPGRASSSGREASSKNRSAGESDKQPNGTSDARSFAPMDLWDRIAWACLHILVVLVPIAMSNLGPLNGDGAPLTYDQFDIVKVFFQRGLVLVAVGAWALGMLLRGGKVRLSKVEWLALAFLAWVVLTSVLSIHPPTAIFGKYRRFEGLLSFLTYGAAFFVALQLADRPSRIRSLARSLVVGGFLVAFYGFLQVIGTVPLSTAQILRPLSLVLAFGTAGVCAWLALVRLRDDRESRLAVYLIGAIALLGGAFWFLGISDNIAYSVKQGLQTVSVDPVLWGQLPFEANRAFSTFGNPDLLGGYLIFPWAVALGLALSEENALWRGLYWVFTIFSIFVGLTSFVRGAWIGATVSLIVIVVAYVRARRGTEMRLTSTDWAFIGSAGAVGVVVAVATSLRADAVRNVFTRILSIFQFDQGSAQTRFQIWQAARDAVLERPVFGWGADTFRLLFPMFKPAEYVQAAGYLSVADNVHNYPLQLATGVGIPGVLMLYGLVVWSLISSAGTALARGTGRERLLLAGFWAAVLGYAVHLLFGLSVTGSTVFLWLSIGVLLSPGAVTHEFKAPSWRVAAVALVVVLVLAVSVLNVRYILADRHYLKGRVLTRGTAAIAELERAVEVNPYNEMYRMELGVVWQQLFRSAAQEVSAQVAAGNDDPVLAQQAEEYLAQAAQAYRDVIDYVPYEYDTYVFLANLYNEGSLYLNPAYAKDAVEIAEKGVAVEKYGPAIRLQLAIAHLTLGQVDEAISQLEFAARLDTNYIQVYTMLGEAYRRAGRLAEARAAYEHVTALYPDNAEALSGLAALEASESGQPKTP